MWKALLWLIAIVFIITLVVEYWLWILLALVVLVGAYCFCVKKQWVKGPKELIASAKGKNAAALPGKRTLTEETLQAVGVHYYQENIRKLACQNPDWEKTDAQLLREGKAGKRIFRNNYTNRPLTLVMESDNPHDANAVAVEVSGETVGYISRDENARIREILKNREIISISGFIGGGEYRIIREDGSSDSGHFGITVSVRIKYI